MHISCDKIGIFYIKNICPSQELYNIHAEKISLSHSSEPVRALIRHRTSTRRVITRTIHPTTRDAHISEHKIAAASTATENIVVSRTCRRRAGEVLEQKVGDDDSVRGGALRSAVQVVLLYIDAVDGDVADEDVAVCDVGDEACSVEVRLDACAVLGVEDLAVGEKDVGNVVVALASN